MPPRSLGAQLPLFYLPNGPPPRLELRYRVVVQNLRLFDGASLRGLSDVGLGGGSLPNPRKHRRSGPSPLHDARALHFFRESLSYRSCSIERIASFGFAYAEGGPVEL